jgi:hypothetical protein
MSYEDRAERALAEARQEFHREEDQIGVLSAIDSRLEALTYATLALAAEQRVANLMRLVSDPGVRMNFSDSALAQAAAEIAQKLGFPVIGTDGAE